ncbi:hypothetical protein Tco_0371178 [Tanacetum coccineum]
MMSSSSTIMLTNTILEVPVLKPRAQPTGLVIDITPPEQPESLPVSPRADRGKGMATNDVESPINLVKASSKVCPDPNEPVRVPYEIHGKLYHLTNDEIQEHLDKEEKIMKAAKEAKLLAELIKVVHEEASKAGIDPKILKSVKGGQEFKKILDAEMKVLNKEHSQKVKKAMKLRKKRIDQYMWTTTNRLKQNLITNVKIHPNTKPAVITVIEALIEGTLKFTAPLSLVTLGLLNWMN